MLGTDHEPGIYVRTLNDLFRAIEETSNDMEYEVSMSYLEVSPLAPTRQRRQGANWTGWPPSRDRRWAVFPAAHHCPSPPHTVDPAPQKCEAWRSQAARSTAPRKVRGPRSNSGALLTVPNSPTALPLSRLSRPPS